MDIRPIRTDEDHRAALAEIEACWVRGRAPRWATSSMCCSRSSTSTRGSDGRSKSAGISIRSTCSATPSTNSVTPSRVGGTPGIALPGLGGSRTPARAHGRDDPQDRRVMENPGRPPCPSIQDRAGGLSGNVPGASAASPSSNGGAGSCCLHGEAAPGPSGEGVRDTSPNAHGPCRVRHDCRYACVPPAPGTEPAARGRPRSDTRRAGR